MNTIDYESIWRDSLIRVTDEFTLPPVVLQSGDAILGTLGNFSVSTGKAKAKKTFNVSAIVAAALVNGQILEYRASFPESKRNILYFDTEQRPYHCQLVMQRLRLAGLPLVRETDRLRFSHFRAIADPNQCRAIICHAIYNTPDVGLVVIDGIRDLMLDINNSIEATRLVVGDLVKWTGEQNIHLHTVLHFNKDDDNAEGILARS